MAKAKSARDKIIDATLTLAAEQPLRDVTMTDIAKVAKMSLGTMRGEFGSRTAILCAFVRRVDCHVLDNADPEILKSTAKDRLFDLLMQRFEYLEAHKAAIRNIAGDFDRDPGVWLRLAGSMMASQRWMLRAAGIATSGLTGRLRVRGLAMVYTATLRVWLKDDDPGLAKTMSELDSQLRRGEQWLNRLEGPLMFAGSLFGFARSFARRRPSSDAAASAE